MWDTYFGDLKSFLDRFDQRENISKRCTEHVMFKSLQPRKKKAPSGLFFVVDSINVWDTLIGDLKSFCARFDQRENLAKRSTESVRFKSLQPHRKESPSGLFLGKLDTINVYC